MKYLMFTITWFILGLLYIPGVRAAELDILAGGNLQFTQGNRTDHIIPGIEETKITRGTLDGKVTGEYGFAIKESISFVEFGGFWTSLNSYGGSLGGDFSTFSIGAMVGPNKTYGGYTSAPLNGGALRMGAYALREHDDQGFSLGLSLGYKFW